jgi:hypothetical protein
MEFYPADAPVPQELVADGFRLRPLLASDAVLDYAAVMASAELLRTRMGGTWPKDDFTLAENRDDLERHEADFAARAGFTYTVMDPGEGECLGCVYLYPLDRVLAQLGVGEGERGWVGAGDAAVTFWARGDRVAEDLDKRLLAALVPWVRDGFAFPRAAYPARRADARLVAILGEAGLTEERSFATADGGVVVFG